MNKLNTSTDSLLKNLFEKNIKDIDRGNIPSDELPMIKAAEKATGGKLWGNFGGKKFKHNWFYLMEIDNADKQYIKGANVKSSETVLRYVTLTSSVSKTYPLVKLNPSNNMVYFLTDEAYEIDKAIFEKTGTKVDYINRYVD